MDFLETIVAAASPDRAWAALADVTSYPRWTASMSSVEPLDGAALAPGHRFRIQQPGLPVTVWQVCAVREGESFAWEARVPGVHTLAHHAVAGQADGTTEITIGIRQTGALAGLVALFTAAKTRRYLRWEAAGLKAAAEAPTPATEDGVTPAGSQ